MAQFIRLSERRGQTSIILQVEQITCIRDLRTDKVTENLPEWHFTGIVCGGCSYEVKETEGEILEKIGISVPKKPIDKEHLLQETIALLSADLYRTLYDRDDSRGFGDVCNDIIGYAKQFEQELNWQEDDDRDYLVELEKFEERILKELHLID